MTLFMMLNKTLGNSVKYIGVRPDIAIIFLLLCIVALFICVILAKKNNLFYFSQSQKTKKQEVEITLNEK